MSKPIFIAEIKTKSPFGYVNPNPFCTMMDFAIQHGDWISVHTNALWGGDFDAISFVRRNTDKPILAKGIHGTDDDVQRALDHGADYVLVVDRIPKIHITKCLLEFSNMEMLHECQWMYFNDPSLKYVCNSRNLRNGLPKKAWELDAYLELRVWTCQASGIRRPSDVDPKVNAFIVGENLLNYIHELR